MSRQRSSGYGRKAWVIVVLGAIGLAAAGIAWLMLAPRQVGGQVSYVITSGSSMEPSLHEGDLVLVRPEAGYTVDDVIAYENPQLGGRVVLHRIIERDGDRYVLQGDNNDFVDPEKPTADQIVGSMWTRIPGAGRVLETLRQPSVAAVLSAGLVLMGFFGVAAGRRKTPRRLAKHSPRTRTQRLDPRTRQIVAAGAGVLLLTSIGLGTLAFARPLRLETSYPVEFRHLGRFSYSAPAVDAQPVYVEGVATGDPVFLRLVDSLDVGFDYQLDAPQISSPAGAARLWARVSSANGWERDVEIGSTVRFEGATAAVDGTLDLAELKALVKDVERLTKVDNQTYRLDINATVEVDAVVEGEEVTETFSPSFSMVLDPEQLQRPPNETATEGADDFRPAGTGTVDVARSSDNRLQLGPLGAPVGIVRNGAIAGAGVALIALLIAAISSLGRSKDEPSRIESRYGPWLVSARSVSGPTVAWAEVEDMDALVRVAERYDRPILHEQHEGVHRYIVQGDGMTYFYRSDDERSA
jgi:signal peptidase I